MQDFIKSDNCRVRPMGVSIYIKEARYWSKHRITAWDQGKWVHTLHVAIGKEHKL